MLIRYSHEPQTSGPLTLLTVLLVLTTMSVCGFLFTQDHLWMALNVSHVGPTEFFECELGGRINGGLGCA
jgi:hypothetical protein